MFRAPECIQSRITKGEHETSLPRGGVSLAVAYATLLIPAPLQAQTTAPASGTVTEVQTGEPLPGVYVVVKGTSVGTATGAEGATNWRRPAQDTLVFTFVGYQHRDHGAKQFLANLLCLLVSYVLNRTHC